MSIKNRKKDHIDLTVTEETQYSFSGGFERYYLKHNALPEMALDEADTSAVLCGRNFSMPLFLSSMTGGHDDSTRINEVIAVIAEELNLPFGVGSQRAMLEQPELTSTFSVVRDKAPNAFIASNIGGVQLIGGLSADKVQRLIDSIEADAVIVHLNPLQELMQPEGDRNFRGVLKGIEDLVSKTDLPVIVKETGAGISAHVARQLLNAGVQVIDIAGAGGTSWAKVENKRDVNEQPYFHFDDWGIPTIDCIEEITRIHWERSFEIIASGGIRSSSDIIKSICLGCHFTAVAQPLIKAVMKGGEDELRKLLLRWKKEMAIHMTLLGVEEIALLSRAHIESRNA